MNHKFKTHNNFAYQAISDIPGVQLVDEGMNDAYIDKGGGGSGQYVTQPVTAAPEVKPYVLPGAIVTTPYEPEQDEPPTQIIEPVVPVMQQAPVIAPNQNQDYNPIHDPIITDPMPIVQEVDTTGIPSEIVEVTGAPTVNIPRPGTTGIPAGGGGGGEIQTITPTADIPASKNLSWYWWLLIILIAVAIVYYLSKKR